MSASGSAWGAGKPSGAGSAASVRPPTSAPSSSPNGLAKAKAAAKTNVNIAAMAARNLGGFVPNKIFVGGVPVTISEEQFRAYFEVYGAISKVELHALRGFGYVTYESVDAVDSCLEKYEDHYFGKKWVEVKRSIPRELIDAYEREQRRLQVEYNVAPDTPAGGNPAISTRPSPKAESSAQSPTVSSSLPAPPTTRKPPPTAAPGVSPSAGGGGYGGKGGAGGPGAEPRGMTSHISQLKDMGFSEEVAKRVLRECTWDVNMAIDRLLASGELPGADSEPAAADDSKETAAAEKEEKKEEAQEAPAPVETTTTAASRPAAWPVLGGASPEPRGRWGAGAPAINTSSSPIGGGGPSPAASRTSPANTGSAWGQQRHRQQAQPQQATPKAAAEEPPASKPPAPTPAAETVPAKAAAGPEPAEEAVPETPAEPTPAAEKVEAKREEKAESPKAQQQSQQAQATNPAAAEPEISEPAPKKAIGRVGRTWSADDASQISVCENDFVEVWVDTKTEHGWIHAEKKVPATGEVGWLPCCILQTLPDGHRFMRIRQTWQGADENQLSVQEGSYVIVWVASQTPEGWTYVEAEKENGEANPGWLPAFCLDWVEA
eukprot:TRINITY_DN29000_c0_g1_i1.p1 TRINITY_DN29000_c0_g1~~TRINITY_DN29000_c0_g1_i1.p1  ORF type:complete len:604 (+),score=181.50 TRINITY_DN29000_c0_g1_i1:91-1902(+)